MATENDVTAAIEKDHLARAKMSTNIGNFFVELTGLMVAVRVALEQELEKRSPSDARKKP